MAQDFFRRLILFNQDISNDVNQYGFLTKSTAAIVLGANPNTISNPAEAKKVSQRMRTAKSAGFIDYDENELEMEQERSVTPTFMENTSTNTPSTPRNEVSTFSDRLSRILDNMQGGSQSDSILGTMFEWGNIPRMNTPGSQAGPGITTSAIGEAGGAGVMGNSVLGDNFGRGFNTSGHYDAASWGKGLDTLDLGGFNWGGLGGVVGGMLGASGGGLLGGLQGMGVGSRLGDWLDDAFSGGSGSSSGGKGAGGGQSWWDRIMGMFGERKEE